MPKIKIRKTAAKRVGITASGALRRRRAGLSHNLTKKTSAKKNASNKPAPVAKANERKIKRMLAI